MIVEPQVFLIGESTVNKEGLSAFLTHLGAPEWSSNAPTDIELLTEVYGRACYISNVIEKGDGSVLEHGVVNFFFCDVSRVFTHELVRHRVGTAMSQESLRYVRLTDLDWYAPICIQENAAAMTIFEKTMDGLSNLQKDLSELYELDTTNDFNFKKQITSAMRRIAPIGLATNIGWSCNMRTLRHVIEMRTDPGAEEEIRIVFAKVADIAMKRWPNLFADYSIDIIDDIPSFKTINKKV